MCACVCVCACASVCVCEDETGGERERVRMSQTDGCEKLCVHRSPSIAELRLGVGRNGRRRGLLIPAACSAEKARVYDDCNVSGDCRDALSGADTCVGGAIADHSPAW